MSTVEDSSVLDLAAAVCALGATTIDLCLSLFDWAPFRSTKAAIKLHTLLDLLESPPRINRYRGMAKTVVQFFRFHSSGLMHAAKPMRFERV